MHISACHRKGLQSALKLWSIAGGFQTEYMGILRPLIVEDIKRVVSLMDSHADDFYEVD